MTDKKPTHSYVCERCGMQFFDDNEYKQHKIDHTLGKKFPIIDPVSGEVLNKDELGQQNPEPKKEPLPVSQIDIGRTPVKLKYIYDGNCLSCGKIVDTLEIDVAEKHFVIAYCNPCKKQIEQREVVKL